MDQKTTILFDLPDFLYVVRLDEKIPTVYCTSYLKLVRKSSLHRPSTLMKSEKFNRLRGLG